jgi:hypothetical protein
MMTKERPLSWSAISLFEYSREAWYKKYILREKQDENQAMKFGKMIGERLASDPLFLPEVPRLPLFEYKLTSRLNDIYMIGFADAFDLENKKLLEFKTGKNWTYKKAEDHGQIDLYCAMIYIMHKIDPKDLDIRLVWLATEETGNFDVQFVKDMKPVIFPLKKTMLDVVNMLARVKRVVKEMEEYIKERTA